MHKVQSDIPSWTTDVLIYIVIFCQLFKTNPTPSVHVNSNKQWHGVYSIRLWWCAAVTSLTSMITGRINLLSVILVTTVSVNVLLVIVSVTRPIVFGLSGNTIPFIMPFSAGVWMVSVTTWVGSWWVTLDTVVSEGLPRKWGGIMAWKSSLVMGLGGGPDA